PTDRNSLMNFSIKLFDISEDSNGPTQSETRSRRVILVPQASTNAVSSWMNGWRRQLAVPPGTLIVIRRADYHLLFRRAPDLMSFAQSEVHEATELMPMLQNDVVSRVSANLTSAWIKALGELPGEMPKSGAIEAWIEKLRSFSL